MTPVIKDCDGLGIVDIEHRLAVLTEKARDSKITLADLSGGTFTISNGGIFGSMMGTPILNMPQVAILGLHAIKERPMVHNGQVL